jgi:hypothetical protein
LLAVPSQLPRSAAVLDPAARSKYRKPHVERDFPLQVRRGTPLVSQRAVLRRDSPPGEQGQGGPFRGGAVGLGTLRLSPEAIPAAQRVRGWEAPSLFGEPSVGEYSTMGSWA